MKLNEFGSAASRSTATGRLARRGARRGDASRTSMEGQLLPNVPSVRSTAYGVVHQLRDPAIYEESSVGTYSALRCRR